MRLKIFNSIRKVNAYPPAKLLGFYLIKAKFNGKLSEEEMRVLKEGINNQDLNGLLSLENEKQYRILMCGVVSNTKLTQVEKLFCFANHNLNLPTTQLAEIFLLSGNEKLLNDCLSKMNKDELKIFATFNERLFVNEMVRRGFLSCLSSTLNHPLNNGLKFKDFYKPNHYMAFYKIACKNGQLEVIKHFEEIFGFNKEGETKNYIYDAYILACGNGHFEVIQHLEKIPDFNKEGEAKNYIYDAYISACVNGHFKVIQHLEKIHDFNIKDAAEADSYKAYFLACGNGHLKVIQHLEEIPGFDKKAAAKANSYNAYILACINGNLKAIEYLEKIPGFDIKEAAEACNYLAYLSACENGHLEVIQHLEKILGSDTMKAVIRFSYEPYWSACENGHLEVIKHLKEILGSKIEAAAKVFDYAAYISACENGQLEVIQHLEATHEFDKNKASEAHNYLAYHSALTNGQLEVIQHLLHTPSCLAYAEKHDREYGEKYVYPFVAEKLVELQQNKLAFETNNPNGVFDVDKEMSKLYFIIIRNLIRRGGPNASSTEDFSDSIRLLLSIPAVRNLCYQRVNVQSSSPGQENELLILALTTDNIAAAGILLGLPEVLSLAEANNYYQDQVKNGPDLRMLAQNRESSMVALSQNERAAIDKLKRHYQQNIDTKGGSDAVFTEFVNLLKSNYEQNRAKISIKNSSGKLLVLELPIDWGKFQNFKLTKNQYEEALKAYFKHDVHTALRYLSKPNKWMHHEAKYVNVMYNKQGSITDGRYSTFENYKDIIALFYTAAFDEQAPAIDGYTIESRKELFIKELALIGRAHNWDKTRKVLDKNGRSITEEYDDLELDKPSCFSGVNRRLFQSLLGHGLFKTVTHSIIKQAINEQLKKYFDEKISCENARALKEAYYGIVAHGKNVKTHIKTLEELNIPADTKKLIIEETSKQLSNTYKGNFNDNKAEFVNIMRNYLNSGSKNDQPDIMAFNQAISLVALIEHKAKGPESQLLTEFDTKLKNILYNRIREAIGDNPGDNWLTDKALIYPKSVTSQQKIFMDMCQDIYMDAKQSIFDKDFARIIHLLEDFHKEVNSKLTQCNELIVIHRSFTWMWLGYFMVFITIGLVLLSASFKDYFFIDQKVTQSIASLESELISKGDNESWFDRFKLEVTNLIEKNTQQSRSLDSEETSVSASATYKINQQGLFTNKNSNNKENKVNSESSNSTAISP